jgi:hypothetical protein
MIKEPTMPPNPPAFDQCGLRWAGVSWKPETPLKFVGAVSEILQQSTFPLRLVIACQMDNADHEASFWRFLREL